MENVVILGSGPSGLAAAIYLAQIGCKPLILESAHPDGRSLPTTGSDSSEFDKPVTSNNTLAMMRAQAIRMGVRFRAGRAAMTSGAPLRFQLEPGITISSRTVIISDAELAHDMDILGGRPQEELGETAFAGGDGFFIQGHQLFVAGGGDDASDDALFLTRFASEARLVQRRMKQRAYANPTTRWAMDMTPIEVIPGELGLHGLKVRMKADTMRPQPTLSSSSPHPRRIGGGMPVEGRPPFVGKSIFLATPGTPTVCHPAIFVGYGSQASRDIHPLRAAAAGCLAAIRCEHYLERKATAV
ncbi:NAD(P)/FAD-dependent oxidoreductase [Paenibacillus methanolicus]|uniref:Thioredoxin reductase (NADPH) n=1 Tax=Paenibacillus methanolicus TaxID=582686 RepID=A0A5S5BUF2_9BACL|nr:NAD(P)/FAD-dependent oxidoreductase [Paenibacillus methanolicus]TYP70647.1 thioredoxin reductase (NADPH) [Paenibacillus methanolicus]